MEKLICNKNLALSAKAPHLSKADKGSGRDGPPPRAPGVYNSRHFLFLFLTGGGQRTARMASSNTVLRPRCVSAEHSRYFTAPAGQNTASQPRPRPPIPPPRLSRVSAGAARPGSTSPGGTPASGGPSRPGAAGFPTDLLRHGQALRVGDGSQLLLLQFLDRVFIIPEIKLRPHQDDGSVGTMVSHFWVPLGAGTGAKSRLWWEPPSRRLRPHRCQAVSIPSPCVATEPSCRGQHAALGQAPLQNHQPLHRGTDEAAPRPATLFLVSGQVLRSFQNPSHIRG